MAKLFSLASSRTRRQKMQGWRRTPLGKVATAAKQRFGGQRGQARFEELLRDMGSAEVTKMVRQLERGGPLVTKYGAASNARQNLERVLGLLGPVGDVIRAATFSKGTPTQSSFDAAAELIRAFGGEVLVPRGEPGYDRGVAAARQLLNDIGDEYTGGTRIGRNEDDLDEYYDEVTYGEQHGSMGGGMGFDTHQTAELIERETLVNSSNVYSYVYQRTSKTNGILYVTFLAWSPGGGERSGAGPTYAYYDVPVTKYKAFKREAGKSAGAAVWDYLRVRGTHWDHQHQYRLVGATLVQETGEFYVPRKAVERGYKRRILALRSTLPPRAFLPDRGTPSRGTPNRGR